MRTYMNLCIKLILTAILVYWATLPYLHNTAEEGFLEEIFKVGIVPGILLTGGFFIMVGFYCRTLQKCLTLIKPENRKSEPKSVWYMFLLPYNFIEDFFIMINISNSLEGEAKSNPKVSGIKDLGLVTGIGWSIAQLLSFMPNIAGQIAGILGLVLWLMHWRLIIRINKLLNTNTTNSYLKSENSQQGFL